MLIRFSRVCREVALGGLRFCVYLGVFVSTLDCQLLTSVRLPLHKL